MPEVAGIGLTLNSDASWYGVSGKLPGTSELAELGSILRSDSFGTLPAKPAVVD